MATYGDRSSMLIRWIVMAENVNFYAAWQPVRINAGLGDTDSGETSGFFINATGLQWNSAAPETANNAFGGWLGRSSLLCLPTTSKVY